MNRIILLFLWLITFSAKAQTSDANFQVFDLNNYKLHMYTSPEAMADVSAIIEGEKELVILEQPSFVNSIIEFNEYVKGLNKPITKIIANYHTGGLAEYPANKVVMMKGMPEFEKGEVYGGMLQSFANLFGRAMDLRPHKKVKTIDFDTRHTWAGIDFVFTAGAKSDFPAASILIGDKVYYSHFAPAKAHFTKMQLPNREAIDAVLQELIHAKSTGSELFIGSHGTPADIETVNFQIEYLQRLKELIETCKDSDTFCQQLIASYPGLDGTENVRSLAKSFYPNETLDPEKEQVRALLNQYTKSISDIDYALARSIWAESDEISIINGLGQFFGFDQIFNDFIVKAFGNIPERKLSSASELIQIYGDMAYIQFYWIFEIKDKQGKAEKRRGRETLICRKVDQAWKIYHIHYSGMPRGIQ